MILPSRILVIEDDEFCGLALKSLLMLHGYVVCLSDNGATGVQKAFEFMPDLILCDIRMNPVDGYQVYNILKESAIVDHIPFIFISGNSELPDIRFGMDLGVDDYITKPFDTSGLIQTVENRLIKYRKLKDWGRNVINRVFDMTPDGLFLFDGYTVFEANDTLIGWLGLRDVHLTTCSIEDFLVPASYQKIKNQIMRCKTRMLNSFSETVTLAARGGEKREVLLHVTSYEKYSGYSLLAGLVIFNSNKSVENKNFLSNIFSALKKENIAVSESLRENLVNIVKGQGINLVTQESGFLSKRESQVLCLSMEGLSIKMIADQLSISDRTVENHRAKLMEKTNSNSIIEVITFALRNNLISI